MMRVAVHQPQYFPYPGFFHKLSMVDAWVVMDDVQYDKRYTNRNRIIAPQGPIWVSVPINKSQKFMPNMRVEINNRLRWREQHLKKISYSYRNSRHYNLYRGSIEAIFAREWRYLYDLDLETTKKVLEWLGIRVEIIRESELGVRGCGTDRLVNACKAVGADAYVSGAGGKGYMDVRAFEQNGIRLVYQNYAPVTYPQRFAEEFVPNLSILDMLANVGPQSMEYILRGEVAGVGQCPDTDGIATEPGIVIQNLTEKFSPTNISRG